MSKVITIGELADLLQDVDYWMGCDQKTRVKIHKMEIEQATKRLAGVLADYLKVSVFDVGLESDDLCGLVVSFVPTKVGEACPPELQDYDPGGDWERPEAGQKKDDPHPVYSNASTGHIHQESMLLYAEDAAVMLEPWKKWEVMGVEKFVPLTTHPCWLEELEYRRIETICINGHDVPKPLSKEPEQGAYYHVASLPCDDVDNHPYTWANDRHDRKFFDAGLCHSTAGNARLHAKALLSFTSNLTD